MNVRNTAIVARTAVATTTLEVIVVTVTPVTLSPMTSATVLVGVNYMYFMIQRQKPLAPALIYVHHFALLSAF
jgi:hypothetical protein